MQESILNGRYRLGRIIGEGGMAVVYLGHDLLLNREIAVKLLREQYAADEGFLSRFEREGQIAAGMTHPNIVSVYDVGNDGGLHYIVMEYIRGPNLKELIHRQGPFSVDGAVFIISQVASALDYAHQRGLVHRDIKPQNILVDRDGNAKVVDFGIAKGMRDQNLTEAGTGMGTVHYVSPEQARGGDIGPSSDLYSTGVVLYEMLTKHLPFDADTPVGVAMHHVTTNPPRPSTLNPNIPPEIDAIVLKALSKDPIDRFPTGAALETAIRFWDDSRRPPSRPLPTSTAPRTRNHSQPAPPRKRDRPAAEGRSKRRQRKVRTQGPPPRRSDRGGGVGCGTWIIGAILLLLIVGIVLALLQWGPEMFDASSASSTSPTSTPNVGAADLGTEILPQIATATLPPTPNPTATESIPATLAAPTATEQTVFPVPELRNATVPEARIAVAGRWILDVQEEFHESVSKGVIFRQDPAPGEETELQQSITVWVSQGKAIVDVPDVTGVSEADAVDQLDESGFEVDMEEEPDPSIKAGLVVRTEPNDQAEPGSTVTIYISLGDVVVIPDLFGVDVFDARDQLEAIGLIVRNVIPRNCNFLHNANSTFECSDVDANEVVAISAGPDPLTWGDVVDRDTSVDLVYLQAAATP